MFLPPSARWLTRFGKKFTQRRARTLFTDASLGLTELDELCTTRRARLPPNVQHHHWKRMQASAGGDLSPDATLPTTSAAPSDTNNRLVLTDDFKTSIALADNDQLDTLVQLLSRYSAQHRATGLFAFPAAVWLARLLHRRRQPSRLYRMMVADWSTGVDHLACYQITMDLLYECKQYDKVIETWHVFRERSELRHKLPYPKTLLALVSGACYQQNTRESFEYGMRLTGECNQALGRVDRKTLVFMAALAMKQAQLGMAYELLSMTSSPADSQQDVYPDADVTVRSLLVAVLARMGRLDEAVALVARLVLEADGDDGVGGGADVAPDALSELGSQLRRGVSEQWTDARTQSDAFASLRRYLTPGGRHVSPWTIEQLVTAMVSLEPGEIDLEDVHALEDQIEHAQTEDSSSGTLPYADSASPALASLAAFVDAERQLRSASRDTNTPRRRRRRAGEGRKEIGAVLDGVASRIREHGPLDA